MNQIKVLVVPFWRSSSHLRVIVKACSFRFFSCQALCLLGSPALNEILDFTHFLCLCRLMFSEPLAASVSKMTVNKEVYPKIRPPRHANLACAAQVSVPITAASPPTVLTCFTWRPPPPPLIPSKNSPILSVYRQGMERAIVAQSKDNQSRLF